MGDFVRVVASSGNASHIFTVESVNYNGSDTAIGIDGSYTGVTEGALQLLVGDAAPGALAEAYAADEVSQASLAAQATADGESAYRYAIEGLVTGAEYFVRVSAAYNDLGQGAPTLSSPAAASPPIQRPAAPAAAQLMGESANSLRVFFNAPESDGGSAVQAYRIDWDTLSAFSSGARSGPLGSTQVDASDLDPSAGAEGRTPCQVTACSFVLSQLETGTEYFVRVAAFNAYGTSVDTTRTSPISRSPSGAPKAPSKALLMPSSASDGSADQLMLYFSPSADSNGAPVSEFRVKWDAIGYDGVRAGGSQDFAGQEGAGSVYSMHAVHTISLKTHAAGGAAGTFRASFGGESTGDLAWDASAAAVQAALRALPTAGGVSVSRYDERPSGKDSDLLSNEPMWGYTWAVTFLGHVGNAGISEPGHAGGLQVSVDSGETFASTTTSNAHNPTLFGGSEGAVQLSTDVAVRAFAGFDAQQIRITAAGGLRDEFAEEQFAVSLNGQETSALPTDVSANELEAALEALPATGGDVAVVQSSEADATTWTIWFLAALGPQPML